MEINDNNFSNEVVKSKLPVLVDFYAKWCGPCQVQAPMIEELEKEFEKKVKVLKLDVDASPQTASDYQIMSIPTLILFNHGQITERWLGLQSKELLKEELNRIIS